MSVGSVIWLAVGLVMLVAGAEFLVKGAAAIASKLGVPAIVIGLTIVAFGTSAPELAVSVSSSLAGETSVAFGNVAGSNIVNVLFILGASAIVTALAVTERIVRLDVPILIVVSVVALLMGLDNRIGRIDGVILVAGVIVYTVWLVRGSREQSPDVLAEYDESVEQLEGATADRPMVVQIGLVLVGLAILVVGSRLLVDGATEIAEALGVSDLVIGLTVVAVGTSLPELATSMLAAFRGQRDIAIGNVIGSNLFNLMFVLGASGVVSPKGIDVTDASLRLDLPVMILVVVILLPIMWNGFEISRLEGVVLVIGYFLYVIYLVLDASENDAKTFVEVAALIFVPVVFVMFTVTGYQGWQRHRKAALVSQD